MNLLTVIFALVGITIIITSSEIFEGIRVTILEFSNFFGKLVSCPMCAGFWIGFFFSLFGISTLSPLFLGAIVSLASWIIYNVVDYYITKSTWYATQIVKDSNDSQNVDVKSLSEVNSNVENESE